MALDFLAGCLGGFAGIMVGYPLDTIKVHIQTQDYRAPKYKGNLHCFRTILAEETVAGLYRGMSSPVAGVAVVNAIIFGVYGQTQRCLSDPESLHSYFIAGALAGIAQSPISCPIELAKTRMQLQKPTGQFSGPLQCLKYTYQQEGYRGVFRGFNITLLRETPSFGIYFLTYEALTRTFRSEPISTPYMLLAGGIAGSVSWTISYPLDVIKSRIQAIDGHRYTGMIDCLKKSVKTEGYGCLYRGLSSTILRAFPTNAVTFAVVTWTFRMFDKEANSAVKTESKSKMVESIKEMAEVGETFPEKWNGFVNNLSESMIIPKLCYSTMSVMSLSDLKFCTATFCQTDERMEKKVKFEEIRENKYLKVEEERLKGGSKNVDEKKGEKKMERIVFEQTMNTVSAFFA
ncbi:mitochondrial basic amino acids transporter-like isoform X1 [Osmia bicornis bicornis]|uniref:mitochondrial basic amino acids transporter-like isoform X1 n=1 Tax=Osmia bicornis bicornis TaxID=1437191 RepID=UPI0010FA5F11|nr:mitochondrial basic amino acids transporter-like isoform X1 [Osmia bicornis bicornis]